LVFTYQSHVVSNDLRENQLAPVEHSYLPEIESVGINMFECVLLLILDRLLEDTDIFGTRDLDREDVTGIIAKHKTVEIEVMTKGV